MTKDFAKKSRDTGNRNTRNSNRKPAPQPSRVPGWVWLFTGAILGAFIMFLMYLSGLAPQPIENTPSKNSNNTEAASGKDMPKPRFDFYKMLKESEVPVTTPSTRPDTQKPTAATPDKEYILQAGSFRSASDADRLRAELIMMNLDAYIETSKIRDDEIWHRVLTGPYDSRSKMAKARGILVSNDISPLLLTRAKSN
ncbi:MAG: SPOR domain-containing protein [Candidatus Pelagadaptatus aseana]|uniref:SPOR domain-containing protein n=1 Tax=Candidatus Pelagadaptatus aseana TaxID=3120508 RepID=UPI0039B1D0BF